MRFKTVTMQNFLSVGDKQSVSLEKQGLVGLIAPNGSGKSTIIEAIVWCLWGSTVRELRADEVINNKRNENCEVVLEFEDGPNLYRVQRYRNMQDVNKKNDAFIYINGAPMTQGVIADTQAIINEVVGLSFETFAQSVLLTSNTKSFCTLADSKQKEVLEDILNIDTLRQAQALTKQKISELQTELAGYLGKLEPIAAHITAVEGDIKTLKTKSDTWERESGLRRKRIHASIKDTKASIVEATAAAAEEIDLIKKVDEARLSAIAIEEEMQEHFDALNEVDEKIANNLRKIRHKKVEHDTVIDLTRDSISRLAGMAGKVCKTCSQPIDVDSAEEQIEELEEKVNTAQNSVINLVMLEGKLATAGDAEKAPYNDALGPLRDSLNGMKTRRAELEEAAHEAAKLSGSLPAFEQRLADLEASATEEDTDNPYTEIIETGKEDIVARKKDAKLLKTKIKAIELDLRGLRFWERGFGNKGLKSYIMDNVVPFLNERAQKYADIMSDGALTITFSTQTRNNDGALREKFNVSVVNGNGANVYKGNSSGERRRSDVAIGWALADLAATRASKPIRFRGLDEPFENLDDEGIDAVFRLLQHATAEYETIFCITHDSALKNRFTNELHVTKQGGYSKISQ